MTDIIKVKVRPGVAKKAGGWFAAGGISDKLPEKQRKFYLSLLRRSGSSLQIDQRLAEQFVRSWRQIFLRADYAELLFDCVHIPVHLLTGIGAMTELVNSTAVALARSRGRPNAIDPMEVLAVWNEHKRQCRRYRNQLTAQLVADDMGISLNTAKKALRNSRLFSKNVRTRFSSTFSEYEVLGMYANDDGTAGIAVVTGKLI